MPFDVMAAVKWLAGLALALLLFFGGRSCGTNAGAEALAACTQSRGRAVSSGQQMSDALEASSKAAKAGLKEAAERMKRADKAVEAALASQAQYETRLDEIQSSMAAGMRQPACRDQLERKTCVILH